MAAAQQEEATTPKINEKDSAMSNPTSYIASLAIAGGVFAVGMYLFGYVEGRRAAFGEVFEMQRASFRSATLTPRSATALADAARIGEFELMP